jgi:hypothetical protein
VIHVAEDSDAQDRWLEERVTREATAVDFLLAVEHEAEVWSNYTVGEATFADTEMAASATEMARTAVREAAGVPDVMTEQTVLNAAGLLVGYRAIRHIRVAHPDIIPPGLPDYWQMGPRDVVWVGEVDFIGVPRPVYGWGVGLAAPAAWRHAH